MTDPEYCPNCLFKQRYKWPIVCEGCGLGLRNEQLLSRKGAISEGLERLRKTILSIEASPLTTTLKRVCVDNRTADTALLVEELELSV